MSSYAIQPGLSNFCQGLWDPDSKTYQEASTIDVRTCCFTSCKNRVDGCYQYCNDKYVQQKKQECSKRCDELMVTCRNSCNILPSPGLDIIDDCINDGGGSIDKDEVIKCCKERCVSSSHPDCNNRCEDMYNYHQYAHRPQTVIGGSSSSSSKTAAAEAAGAGAGTAGSVASSFDGHSPLYYVSLGIFCIGVLMVIVAAVKLLKK